MVVLLSLDSQVNHLSSSGVRLHKQSEVVRLIAINSPLLHHRHLSLSLHPLHYWSSLFVEWDRPCLPPSTTDDHRKYYSRETVFSRLLWRQTIQWSSSVWRTVLTVGLCKLTHTLGQPPTNRLGAGRDFLFSCSRLALTGARKGRQAGSYERKQGEIIQLM